MSQSNLKLYIAVREEVPDYMVPVLVAHSVLGSHLSIMNLDTRLKTYNDYTKWLLESFKKCVISVNKKEYEKIKGSFIYTYEGYESTVMDGMNSCIIPPPLMDDERPNVIKFAKLWKPKNGS